MIRKLTRIAALESHLRSPHTAHLFLLVGSDQCAHCNTFSNVLVESYRKYDTRASVFWWDVLSPKHIDDSQRITHALGVTKIPALFYLLRGEDAKDDTQGGQLLTPWLRAVPVPLDTDLDKMFASLDETQGAPQALDRVEWPALKWYLRLRPYVPAALSLLVMHYTMRGQVPDWTVARTALLAGTCSAGLCFAKSSQSLFLEK